MTLCFQSSAFLVIGTLLTTSKAATALADESSQIQARDVNNQGSAAYDLGNYDEAIDLFARAYKTYPDARILFNLAQAYRKKRDYERALNEYRAYLRNMPDAPNRSAVEGLLGELERLVATQRASDAKPPQGVAPTGPRAPQGVAPTGPEAPVSYVSRVTEPRPWYTNAAGWWLVGGGTIAAGTGIGFFVSTLSLDDRLNTAPENERPDIRSDISTRRTIGAILTTVGGLAIAGGVVVFIVSPRTVTREVIPIKDLRLSAGPSWLAVSGRF